MKVLRLVFGIALTASFFSCENEVEINADFQEKTYVLGLLSAQRRQLKACRLILVFLSCHI